jgi:cytochrome c
MKASLQIAGLAILCGTFASVALADAPGSYAACAACHSTDGSPSLGPTLKGAFGRKAGTASGFAFSPAMKSAGVTWDEKTLNEFLADPQKKVPGNSMPFPGVADAKQRADIIDYLKSIK